MSLAPDSVAGHNEYFALLSPGVKRRRVTIELKPSNTAQSTARRPEIEMRVRLAEDEGHMA